MSEIIDTYEYELIGNLKSANEKIIGTFQTKQEWKEFRALLTECEKNIKLIQTQLIGQPASFRAGKTAKLREYKKKFDILKRTTFEKENNWELQMGKKQLIGNRTASTEVIKTYDRSAEVSEKLRQSVKVMNENLQISQNVGNQLSGQTQKLIKSKSKVVQVRHALGKSERKIKSMMLRIKKNKFVLRGVIAFITLILIIVLVSYFR